MLTRRLQAGDTADDNWQFDPSSTVVDPLGSLLLSSYQRAAAHADMPSQNTSDPAWYISLRNVALQMNAADEPLTYHLRCTLVSVSLALSPSMLLLPLQLPAGESSHCFRWIISCIEHALVCKVLAACVAGTWSRV